MTGFRVVNLRDLVEECGEDFTKEILSRFSCPLNKDVEYFLRNKAIDFSKQRWSQTHLVFASFREEWKLVGYFTLSSKAIKVEDGFFRTKSGKSTRNTLRKRISHFAKHDPDAHGYIISAPLIAQLGKNYTDGLNELISGDELLGEACKKIRFIQDNVGGRFTYLECEDKPKLIDFYSSNGFVEFARRTLDKEEVENLDGSYLVQMIKYIK